MKFLRRKISVFLAFALSFLLTIQSWAISREMNALVKFETGSNAVSTRSSTKILVEHYEIPLRLVESDVALRIDPKIMQSLIFEKNGEKYIRWIINPEDTTWYKEVETLMLKNEIPVERKQYFEGYQTASRSYIIVDPVNKAEFSAKVSTDKTGGNWTDKKQTYEDAWQIRMVADYVNDLVKKGPELKNIILLDEPAIFGLKEIDHGMVIREYGKLAKSGHYYVPGFSIMHDETGRKLAKLNGSDDPAAYWNENYNKPLARAIAEFVALTGMTYDSPHSQNFLVELDKNKKPTGKIVFRDYGDTYLSEDFFTAIGRPDIPQRWELQNVLKDRFSISVGILHGNKAPSWINPLQDLESKESYNQWGRDFYSEFSSEFSNQTGVSLTSPSTHLRAGMYFQKRFDLNDKNGLEFMELVKAGKQRAHLNYGKCSHVLAM